MNAEVKEVLDIVKANSLYYICDHIFHVTRVILIIFQSYSFYSPQYFIFFVEYIH